MPIWLTVLMLHESKLQILVAISKVLRTCRRTYIAYLLIYFDQKKLTEANRRQQTCMSFLLAKWNSQISCSCMALPAMIGFPVCHNKLYTQGVIKMEPSTKSVLTSQLPVCWRLWTISFWTLLCWVPFSYVCTDMHGIGINPLWASLNLLFISMVHGHHKNFNPEYLVIPVWTLLLIPCTKPLGAIAGKHN